MRRLKAACEAYPSANKVMNGRNPISKFIVRQRTIKTELTGEQIPSKEQIFKDPKMHCTKFLETLEERLENHMDAREATISIGMAKGQLEKDIIDTEKRINDVPASGATEAQKEAEKIDREMLRDQKARLANLAEEFVKKERLQKERHSDLTGDIIDELETQIDRWVTGEAYIYDLAIESLKKKTALIVKTQGAGRLQLRKLEEKHNLKTPKTTDTMVYIWSNLKIKKTETVEDFRERWDELLEDMNDAVPEPLRRTTGEKRLKYLQAFENGSRFLEEHKEFKKSKTSIEDMEDWFTTLENQQSLELLARHDMSHEGIVNMPEGEIYNYEATKRTKFKKKRKQKGGKKKLPCFHFQKHGTCRHGNNCRFEHGTKAIETRKGNKDKSKIDCKFHKKGTCTKGSKCSYRHSSKATVANFSAYDLVDVPVERQTEIMSTATADVSMMSAHTKVDEPSTTLTWFVIPVRNFVKAGTGMEEQWEYMDLYSDDAQSFLAAQRSIQDIQDILSQGRMRPDDIQTDVLVRSLKYDLEVSRGNVSSVHEIEMPYGYVKTLRLYPITFYMDEDNKSPTTQTVPSEDASAAASATTDVYEPDAAYAEAPQVTEAEAEPVVVAENTTDEPNHLPPYSICPEILESITTITQLHNTPAVEFSGHQGRIRQPGGQ